MRVLQAAVPGIALLAVVASATAPASARVAGDTGRAPTSGAQCRAFLKSVDGDLAWEKDRYAKARAKKLGRRTSAGRRIKVLQARQVALQAREREIIASLEVEPPPAQAVADAGMAEVEANRMTFGANRVKIQALVDQIEGIGFELAELAKTHRSNVRNTLGYRKQVAAYCRRF